jgi:glyoxylase-like metal-dependent hydrolase (beta-lactamase superfamily II)
MKRTTISTGTFEVNCSILTNGADAMVVDPGGEPERIIAIMRKEGASLKAILLTHAHFDHIGAVNKLLEEHPDTPVYIGENDMPVVSHPFNQLPPDYPPCAPFPNMRPASEAPGIEAIPTPGHTPGGVCYFIRDFAPETNTPHLLLSGDTLFAGSIGRTDNQWADYDALMSGIFTKLMELDGDITVIPGHGPETTIATERTTNPFLMPFNEPFED